jgi:hypothetical protein
MAQINRISSFKTFSEIKANEAAIKLAEENAIKRSEITSKISTILDEMEINSLEDLTEEARKELISKAFGEVSEEAEEENLPEVAELEDEEVSEAVIVTGKRDAKKVLTAYTKFFERYPALADSRFAGLHLGSIKTLMVSALGDANFHREAPVCGKAIKGAKVQPVFIKPLELNKTEIKIPVGRVMSILDDNASLISGAAGWSGIGIAEGTALYLESIKASKIAEDVIAAFNSTFESVQIMEAKVEEGRAFVAARAKAIEEEAEEFEFNGKKYPVIKENSLVVEGTRGQFGKIDKKGNITSVYTHYDSYPENMLPIIKKAYKNGKDVDSVIDQGDMSGLDVLAKINFYGGDFKPSKGTINKVDKYLRDIADDGGAEYAYLWDESSKKWMMADIYGDMELVPAFESLIIEGDKAKVSKKEVQMHLDMFKSGDIDGEDLAQAISEIMFGKTKAPGMESVVTEAKYNKKSLLKKLGKADDATIQTGNGKEYVIYNPDSNNDDNAAMWNDNSVFAVDQDGEEHEIDYKDIGLVMVESKVNEATVEMDATDPKSKGLKKLLKKHNVKMKVLTMEGPSGHPEVEMTGSREDLKAVLADGEYGWDDAGLEEYIEESVVTESHPKCSNKKGHAYKEIDKDGTVECEYCGLRNSLSESVVNEAEIKSDEEFTEYANTVLQKAFGEDFDEAKAKEVIDGILSKCGDDYGACVGTLTSSLS